MPKVFISSTKNDLLEYREAAVEICQKLELQPLDMKHFPAEGRDGVEGSKRQLEKADVCVVIVAHRYGEVTEKEFDHADKINIERLCFIIDDDYPWPIDRIDFDRQDKLKKFKEKISNETIRARFTTLDDFKVKLMQALTDWMKRENVAEPETGTGAVRPTPRVKPLRPDLLVGREQDAKRIKRRMGIADSAHQDMTVVRGWPGVGKTTLINSLVYDDVVQNHFADGVFWAVLGENANPFSELVSWGRQLGIYDIGNVKSLEEAIRRVKAVLHEKNALLIVDDAWNADDAIPFKQVRGADCHLLVTTRFPEVARKLVDTPNDIYLLDVLVDEKAYDLLEQLAPNVVRQYPDESLTLVQDIEGLPLAIRVAGRMLEEELASGFDVLDVIQDIREDRKILEETAPADRFDPATGTTPTIQYLLKRSTDRLAPAMRERFAILGAFAPKPATFDLPAMTFMWEFDAKEAAKPSVKALINRGLLEFLPTIERYQMHALLVMHAQNLLEEMDEDA